MTFTRDANITGTGNRLVQLAQYWATTRGAARAFVFLGPENVELQVLNYSQLDAAARSLAKTLAFGVAPGGRAVLMFPSGLAFVIAFFACHYAGVVPVPVVPVRRKRMRDAALSVIHDCSPDLLLAPTDYMVAAAEHLRGLQGVRCRLVPVDFDAAVADASANSVSDATHPTEDLAFIQYTSGSTSAPKGVCVSQANLFANLEMIHAAVENPLGVTYVGWAPHYHDMGLIGNLLAPFYLGGQCVLMSPEQFAGSPSLWLRAISYYRARTSGGPNFAYDLCIAQAQRILREPLELSCWKVAFSSGEPVHAQTMRQFSELFADKGFAANAMYPAFGMAEATLFVSGGSLDASPIIERVSKVALGQGALIRVAPEEDCVELVGCGRAALGSRIAIVDPESRLRRKDGMVGEVWIAGNHIPERYWQRPEDSEKTFHARLADAVDGERYLRSGDLGVLLDGELFITGRLKDLMIIRGKNVYPQDIEQLAATCADGLAPNASAAFVVDEADTLPRMFLVQEVERSHRRSLDQGEVASAIRQAVFREFDCTLHDVVFVEPGSILKTSSGKIRRAAIRQALLAGTLLTLSAQVQSTDAQRHATSPLDLV